MQKGLVYVFTGEGKGKTSAGMWTAMRASLSGMKVAVIHWYKEAGFRTNDQKLIGLFPNLNVYMMGSGFYIKKQSLDDKGTRPVSGGGVVVDHEEEDIHKLKAKKAFLKAKREVGKVELLVLDEVLNALVDNLISENELIKLIEKRGSTHFVLTGRGASEKIIDSADLVTEMRKVKHPYDKGVGAVFGLDF